MTDLTNDRLEGVDAIAAFLGAGWTARKVRYARETGALPIRLRKGTDPSGGFKALSASLHAIGSWNQNPDVCVIGFSVRLANIDAATLQ